jgi:hypothetical protein
VWKYNVPSVTQDIGWKIIVALIALLAMKGNTSPLLVLDIQITFAFLVHLVEPTKFLLQHVQEQELLIRLCVRPLLEAVVLSLSLNTV